MKKETQYIRIIKALKKRPKTGMTNFDLMVNCRLCCPEKRIRELIDRKGIDIEWERNKNGDGLTVYTLKDPNQKAIRELMAPKKKGA